MSLWQWFRSGCDVHGWSHSGKKGNSPIESHRTFFVSDRINCRFLFSLPSKGVRGKQILPKVLTNISFQYPLASVTLERVRTAVYYHFHGPTRRRFRSPGPADVELPSSHTNARRDARARVGLWERTGRPLSCLFRFPLHFVTESNISSSKAFRTPGVLWERVNSPCALTAKIGGRFRNDPTD